jgi:TonB-linked SusC/RagA family outer membrane protein
MSGVHIKIKGSNTGTFSDQQGEYSLTVNNKATLIFSYLGYHSRELPILGRTTLDVQMQSEVTELQEVEINAGYYTVKEKERTGSISRVTAKEIELQPIVSPLEALQGRMAGVEVVQSAIPGTATSIRIRGQNSLRNALDDNGNRPLYIIDGLPINSSPIYSFSGLTSLTGVDPLNTLNLSNIESIEILKDADATAIYGSRGANGVILITTKGGKNYEKRTDMEVRLYSGIGKVSNTMDLLNTEQYLALRREAFDNDGVTPTEVNARDLLLWNQDRYTDWQKELFGGTAVVTNLNLAVSGSAENTSFRLGGSYHKAGNVFPGDFDYNKLTVGLNLDHRSKNDKFRMNLSLNYGIDNNDLFNSTNYVDLALSLAPNAPALYTQDGQLNWENSTWTNPLATLNNSSSAKANNLVSNLGLTYQLVSGLLLKANMGYTSLESEEKVKTPIRSYDPALWDRISHRSLHSYTKRNSWILEPQLVYNLNLGKAKLDALVGVTFQQSNDNDLRIIGTGYADEQFIGNLAATDRVTVTSNQHLTYKYNALFARIGFNWNARYFINLTGRRDGSSRFGADKRFANFGAIGGAWIFSEENFIKNTLPFLSFGKFRGSYGITGSDQIGDYGYLDTYEATPGPGGLYPTGLSNPDYSWESNRKLEAAMELGLFRDRVNLGVSWYRNRSSNQLVGYPLPSTTGFSLVQANLPATVQNTGWEFEWSSLNVRSDHFNWRTSLNLTIPNNKLLDFPDLEQTSYRNLYRVGKPLNIALLYQYDGIDPETGFQRVLDVNQDGRYDYDDRIIVTNLGREYYGGINNEFTIKNFSLTFLWEFVKQDGYLPTSSAPGRFGNSPKDYSKVQNGTIENSDLPIASQSITAFRAYRNAQSSNFGIGDASFVRLKTLAFSYDLPKALFHNNAARACKIFLHAQNLFTITDYKGLDPQFPGARILPAIRNLSCGVQFNF